MSEKVILNFKKVDSLLEGNVSNYLDCIRGLAAILVLMEHLSPYIFSNFSNQSSLVVKMIYMVNLLGGPSVRIFFVLSGLFISRSILKMVFEDRWSWRLYLINRLSRLYAVLIPALIITIILDTAGKAYLGGSYNWSDDSLSTFVGNALFLQGIVVPTFGTNHPLWSLSYEFWYYILFPIITLIIVKTTKVKTKIFYLGLLVLLFAFVGYKIILSFLVWLMGTLVLYLPFKKRIKNKKILFLILPLFVFSLFLRPLILTGKLFGGNQNTLIFIDSFSGIAFVLFIYTLLLLKFNNPLIHKKSVLFDKISKNLAGFSYSLYLIHQPILDFAHGLAIKYGYAGIKPNVLSFALEFCCVLIMLAIALVFSRFTEAKTNVIRKHVIKLLFKEKRYKKIA